ncbi:MAG: IS1595 family transposase [Gemmatimonadota bacterium]|nr:IS1595 family transposase [Gemmatimonadota bacterium]
MAKASKGVNYNAPGRAHREGVTLVELAERFPTEEAAREWFEAVIWPNGERCCTRCGSLDTVEAKHKTMPYRCRDCRRYFSAKMGTALEGSKVTYKQWVYAIYLSLTNLKGVSSLKIRRDLGVSQPTAWFIMHRLREACGYTPEEFDGPVEVDETHIGGLKPNMPLRKRRKVAGRGPAGKTVVIGAKDRATNRVSAKVIERKDAPTLQGFVESHRKRGAKVYTDEWASYKGLENHEVVKHSVREYVNGQAHTNGMESFWGMLKRGYHGVFHYMSPRHLHRYVNEYAGKHNIRDMDTLDQMQDTVARLVGKRLLWRDLTAKEAA